MFFVLGTETMTPEFVHEFSDALNDLTTIGRITLVLSIAVIVCVVFLTAKTVYDSWSD